MTPSPAQIRELLLKCTDKDANVIDMGGVLQAISSLEKLTITKEALEETRLGKLINEIRKAKSLKNAEVAERCRRLVKQWHNQFVRKKSAAEGASSSSPGYSLTSNAQQNQKKIHKPLIKTVLAPTTKVPTKTGGTPVDETKSENRKRRKQTSPASASSPDVEPPAKRQVTETPPSLDKIVPVKKKRGRPRKYPLPPILNETPESQTVGTTGTKTESKDVVSQNSSAINQGSSSPQVVVIKATGKKVKKSNSSSVPPNKEIPNSSRAAVATVKLKDDHKASASSSNNVSISTTPSKSAQKQSKSKKSPKGGNHASVEPERSLGSYNAKDSSSELNMIKHVEDIQSGLFSGNEEDVLNCDVDAHKDENAFSIFDDVGEGGREKLSSVVHQASGTREGVSTGSSDDDDDDSFQPVEDLEPLGTDDANLSKVDDKDEGIFEEESVEISQMKREITEDDLRLLHEGHWVGVNGHYNSTGDWRGWAECLTIDATPESTLHILPYVCID